MTSLCGTVPKWDTIIQLIWKLLVGKFLKMFHCESFRMLEVHLLDHFGWHFKARAVLCYGSLDSPLVQHLLAASMATNGWTSRIRVQGTTVSLKPPPTILPPEPAFLSSSIITARIRKMTEGNIFSLSAFPRGGAGGRGAGTPSSQWGVSHPSQSQSPSGWQGVPQSTPCLLGLDGGTTPQSGLDRGYPPVRTGWGYFPPVPPPPV